MTKTLFFSSPIGLGHVTRDSAIADLFDAKPEFVTGAGAAKYLQKLNYPVQDVYNPPSFTVKNGSLEKSLSWLWKYYKYYKECKQISKKIVEKKTPNLVISDEDFASLTVAQSKSIPTILITDILETRFTSGVASIIEKKMNKSMKEIIKKCDAVILPENGKSEENIYRVGPIVRKTNYSREELRKKFEFAKKTIVISVGGTESGKFLIEKTLDVIPKFKDVEFVFVSGPSIQMNLDNARNLGFVPNLHEIIFASDVVISLAGKSTMDEARAYGTPGIFIPIKDHFEQEDNAKEEGFVFDDVFRLEQLIAEKLDSERKPHSIDGTQKAYEIIKSYL